MIVQSFLGDVNSNYRLGSLIAHQEFPAGASSAFPAFGGNRTLTFCESGEKPLATLARDRFEADKICDFCQFPFKGCCCTLRALGMARD